MSKLKKEEKFLWNQNAKASFETFKDSNSLITSLCFEYIGALNQKDPMLFFIDLLPNW